MTKFSCLFLFMFSFFLARAQFGSDLMNLEKSVFIKERTVLLEVKFWLTDSAGNYYSSKDNNDGYFSKYIYLIPIVSNMVVFSPKHFFVPARDTIYKYINKGLKIRPELKEYKFIDWTNKILQIPNSFDTVNSNQNKLLTFNCPIKKKSFIPVDSLNKSKLINVEFVYLHGTKIDSLSLKSMSVAIINSENTLQMALLDWKVGILVDSNKIDKSQLNLIGFNKGEIIFRVTKVALAKNKSNQQQLALVKSLKDSIPIIQSKVEKRPKGKVNKVDKESLSSKSDSKRITKNQIDTSECNKFTDTIYFHDPGNIDRYQTRCKIGYKSDKYIFPAIFDKADPFFTKTNELGFNKVKAYQGDSEYIVHRNLRRTRKIN